MVTSFTAKVHPAPRFVGTWSFAATAPTPTEFEFLLKVVLTTLADAMVPAGGQNCASGGIGLGGGLKARNGGEYTMNFTCNGYESNTTQQAAFFKVLLDYTSSRAAAGVTGASTWWTWTQAQYNTSAPSFPWMMKQVYHEQWRGLCHFFTPYLLPPHLPRLHFPTQHFPKQNEATHIHVTYPRPRAPACLCFCFVKGRIWKFQPSLLRR